MRILLAFAASVAVPPWVAAQSNPVVRIEIALSAGEATVEAVIALNTDRAWRASLAVFPDQDLRFSTAEAWTLESAPGIRWLVWPGGLGEVRLSYVVRGDLSRIPLPVPDIPMRSGDAVSIRVDGLEKDAPLQMAFPRMVWREGAAEVSMRDVPSFLRLPRRDWGLTQWSQVGALVLVLGAALDWVRRHWARQARADG